MTELDHQILEGSPHEFDPYGIDWTKPRCKRCGEFEDHRVHCLQISVEGGPDICQTCSKKIRDYVVWEGHTGREMKLIHNLSDRINEFDEHLFKKIENAWLIEGVQPSHHKRMQNKVRNLMPILGRALDELED